MLVLSIPAIFSLEITPNCQNRCLGCSNARVIRRSAGFLEAAVWEKWLAGFGPQAVRIRITGGEPSLHPQFHRIVQATNAFQAWVTIFTNGRWLHPDEFLAKLRGLSQLSGLLVSLHGSDAADHEAFCQVPGAFHETTSNIKKAADVGIGVAISCVVNRLNFNKIDEIADLGVRLGAEHIAMNRYIGPAGFSLQASHSQLRHAVRSVKRLAKSGIPVELGTCVPQCLETNRSKPCQSGFSAVAIGPRGEVRPCIYSPTIAGSLQHSDLGALWSGEIMDSWRRNFLKACESCAALQSCGGSCRAERELRNGSEHDLAVKPLPNYQPLRDRLDIPADGCPLLRARVRRESFGLALLGAGQVMAARAEAIGLLQACDGKTSFKELAARFGTTGLEFLGDAWEAGMLTLGIDAQ